MEKATIETMVTMLSLEATTTMMTISLKPRMLMTVTLEARTVMMVTREARAITMMSDAFNWNGFKLHGHTMHGTRGGTNDGAMNLNLELTRLGNMEVGYDTSMKTKMT